MNRLDLDSRRGGAEPSREYAQPRMRDVKASFMSTVSKGSSRRNVFGVTSSESFNSRTTPKAAGIKGRLGGGVKRLSSNMRMVTQKSTDRDVKKMAYQATAQKYLSSCKSVGIKKYKFFFSKDSSNKQASDAASAMESVDKRSNALSSLHTNVY